MEFPFKIVRLLVIFIGPLGKRDGQDREVANQNKNDKYLRSKLKIIFNKTLKGRLIIILNNTHLRHVERNNIGRMILSWLYVIWSLLMKAIVNASHMLLSPVSRKSFSTYLKGILPEKVDPKIYN